jgi:uncharacterized membrane protein YphA (DoxX/SURF4 family)
MKFSLQIIRWLVGVLFIFSGLVKANDPLGLAYKMEEFFEAWNWLTFSGYVLQLSILMNVLEVLAGVALLIGWRIKLISRLLLLLIIFFTFLTSYVLFSGKIKNCGCFGDCIPLTPIQTFIKDIALLCMVVFICFKANAVKSFFTNTVGVSVLMLTIVVVASLQWYVLSYLPLVDCLPYKKKNNIIEQMKVPAGAVTDSFAISYQYKKNGQIITFDANHFPNDFDSTYQYINRFDKLVRKGNTTPKIIDFTLKTISGNDTTNAIFSLPNYVLVFVQDAIEINKWEKQYEVFVKEAHKKMIPVFLVSADAVALNHQFKNTIVFSCDGTVIKTAARVKPTYFFMKEATIVNKLSFLEEKKLMQELENF